VPFFSTHKL
jgi:glycerophosphoryl diester phosphodiesterase